MRDHLLYPERCRQPTLGEWCEKHSVTDEEYEPLLTYLFAMRMRAAGILSLFMIDRR